MASKIEKLLKQEFVFVQNAMNFYSVGRFTGFNKNNKAVVTIHNNHKIICDINDVYLKKTKTMVQLHTSPPNYVDLRGYTKIKEGKHYKICQ